MICTSPGGDDARAPGAGDFDTPWAPTYHKRAMPAGRIGSAELSNLVAGQAQRDVHYRVADMDRLAGVVSNPLADSGELEARLEFLPGSEGYPQLRLRATGVLMLTCQRCLESFPWRLDLDVQLTVLGSEADATRIGDPFEAIVMAADGLSPVEVLEDEVLAVLPLVPMHPQGACGGPHGAEYALGADEAVAANKPFDDLAALLGRRARRTDD